MSRYDITKRIAALETEIAELKGTKSARIVDHDLASALDRELHTI